MLTCADLDAWLEIQDGLARAAEREFEARVMTTWQQHQEHYERRRREIYEEMAYRS